MPDRKQARFNRGTRFALLITGLTGAVIILVSFAPRAIVPLAPRASGRPLVVLITGDNGWASIDSEIAGALNDVGFGVVGIVVPPFLGQRQTPEEATQSVVSVADHYMSRWKSRGIFFVGYSRGAGVIPFIVSRLPLRLSREVEGVALIGLEPMIDFKYAPRLLFTRPDDELTIPVLPELRRIRERNVLCIRGSEEKGSLCDEATALGLVRTFVTPGTHHIGGDRRVLAFRILQRLSERPLRPQPSVSRSSGI